MSNHTNTEKRTILPLAPNSIMIIHPHHPIRRNYRRKTEMKISKVVEEWVRRKTQVRPLPGRHGKRLPQMHLPCQFQCLEALFLNPQGERFQKAGPPLETMMFPITIFWRRSPDIPALQECKILYLRHLTVRSQALNSWKKGCLPHPRQRRKRRKTFPSQQQRLTKRGRIPRKRIKANKPRETARRRMMTNPPPLAHRTQSVGSTLQRSLLINPAPRKWIRSLSS
mmetsp:Transcript_14611/g.21579  ORF Transcript_14611/g.21579 Transcript_14611/m.21579 type:complete len:225 (+) Transcript_14611:466-1140(+)